MKCVLVVFAWVFAWTTVESVRAAERVLFLSGSQTLQACVYKPEGKGPFPAVVFNQNSPKTLSGASPDPFPELSKFYTKRGYVLFVPGRHTVDLTKPPAAGNKKGKRTREQKDAEMAEHQAHADHLVAAMNWLLAQNFVNEKRVVVVGSKAGAIAALLAVEELPLVRGYVLFSPAAGRWKSNGPLQAALAEGIKSTTAPIFLIQQQSDSNLKPAQVLGAILEQKGPPNTSKVYEGSDDPDENKAFASASSAVWGRDVLRFIDAAFGRTE